MAPWGALRATKAIDFSRVNDNVLYHQEWNVRTKDSVRPDEGFIEYVKQFGFV